MAGLLASCSSSAPAARPAVPGHGLTWMLTKAALSQLCTDPAVRSRLEGAPVYEILRPGQRPLGRVGAIPVVTVRRWATLSRRWPARAGRDLGVLYDVEAWPFTPRAEQQNPAAAARQALATAHAHGLKLIVAPALNLTTLLPTSGPRWRQFLDQGLAGRRPGPLM